MFQTAMPSIMLGRQRFPLPIGETRLGGAGDDALPFPELRGVPTMAVLVVTASGTVSLWPSSGDAAGVTVNGVPLRWEPLPVTHGAKIELAAVLLIFRDGRETGSTGPAPAVPRAGLGGSDGEAASAVVPEGARLVRRESDVVIAIPDSGLVVGRDADSDLVIPGIEVSRRHAVLRRSIRGYALTDVSTNGTYVNGRRVDGSVVLRVGDVLRIGEAEFRFEAGAATHDPAATPPALRFQPVAEAPTAIRPAAGIWRRLSKGWRP
jgi:hypothetical protein